MQGENSQAGGGEQIPSTAKYAIRARGPQLKGEVTRVAGRVESLQVQPKPASYNGEDCEQ